MTRFNTQLVHGLPVGDNNTGAVNPPIYNSTTYAFEKVDAMPVTTMRAAAIPHVTSWNSRSPSSSRERVVLRSPPVSRRFTRC